MLQPISAFGAVVIAILLKIGCGFWRTIIPWQTGGLQQVAQLTHRHQAKKLTKDLWVVTLTCTTGPGVAVSKTLSDSAGTALTLSFYVNTEVTPDPLIKNSTISKAVRLACSCLLTAK